jgi:hypothetical protein
LQCPLSQCPSYSGEEDHYKFDHSKKDGHQSRAQEVEEQGIIAPEAGDREGPEGGGSQEGVAMRVLQ